jgi:hypothetical protein
MFSAENSVRSPRLARPYARPRRVPPRTHAGTGDTVAPISPSHQIESRSRAPRTGPLQAFRPGGEPHQEGRE